jgi:Fungal N-terminal domain of STAND proteins/NACHT domain
MDIASNIAGLIGLADLIFRKVFWYIKTVKNAEKEIQSFSNEINTLSGILHSLHLTARQLDGEDFDRSLRAHHIYFCQRTLESISAKLEKAFPLPEKAITVKSTFRKLSWPFSSNETKEFIAELQRHKSTFNLGLSVDNLSSLLKVLSQQDTIQDGIDDIKTQLRQRWDLETRISLTKQRAEVLRFFCPVDPQLNHDISLKLRHPGTGLWLTESEEFRTWLNTKNSHLWLYGIPGAGKTVLASSVIEEAFKKSDKDNAVSFYYCDYKNEASQSPESILGGIASHIARQDEQCFEQLQRYHEELNPSGNLPKQIDPVQLLELILQMANHFENVAIIVDGLDECGKMTSAVAGFLVDLGARGKNIKTLILSRNEQHIRDFLDDYEQISIAARSGDLKLYVAAEVELRIRNKRMRIKSEELKEKIMTKLINGADGM